jgi:hypothetical protein
MKHTNGTRARAERSAIEECNELDALAELGSAATEGQGEQPATNIDEIEIRLDARALRMKHIIALEEATGAGEIFTWLVAHGGCNRAQLDELTLADFDELRTNLLAEIRRAQSVPKAKRAS